VEKNSEAIIRPSNDSPFAMAFALFFGSEDPPK
jgi:hypothetical protein